MKIEIEIGDIMEKWTMEKLLEGIRDNYLEIAGCVCIDSYDRECCDKALLKASRIDKLLALWKEIEAEELCQPSFTGLSV